MEPSELYNLTQDVLDHEIWSLLKQGQEEYASNSDAFSNFKGQGKELDMDPKVVLWIHAMKHKSGIANYLKGVKSQREGVRERINDLIVYLLILRGIIEEEEENLRKRMDYDKGKGIFYSEAETREYLRTGKWPHESVGRTDKKDEKEKPKTDQEESAPL